jgi:hypothetical protein
MQESVIYQDIRAEAIQEGLQQGETTIVLRSLAQGGASPLGQAGYRHCR